ncbi:MAG: SET domain-containing protein-lysine N-methyltransferase [Verrucomicrobiae bacterium]|nr:SET domain-containing protein-lysine N-methyltransferase [Verrucomicrobiae bacterium]
MAQGIRGKARAATTSPHIEVRRSEIHGTGVFASREIARGTKVLEYVGEKIGKAEAERRSIAQIERASASGGAAVFVFELNSRYDIDGDVPWNTARFINHSCSPNCEVEIARGRIWIVARRRIRAGEELSYDYGYDFEAFEEHPCRCGSRACAGYIVRTGLRRRLKRVLAENSKPGA